MVSKTSVRGFGPDVNLSLKNREYRLTAVERTVSRADWWARKKPGRRRGPDHAGTTNSPHDMLTTEFPTPLLLTAWA
jgi:hypothetical protein